MGSKSEFALICSPSLLVTVQVRGTDEKLWNLILLGCTKAATLILYF
jgi:hypothetical protein